ncbi:MAG TPA: 1-acyl-sn-glycerol-3-phosphate acyltransferase, partial [Saprospiraceae bacterium]|nr:1-acyl-sn-glycerol-3-phosphate acyltransferase [Saprospiraceae bacterium]
MFYRFLYYVIGWTLKVFYRKIYVNGAEKLKEGQAYILTSNHPAGFVEPLIMACYLHRDLYFLTRGDLFENPLYNKVFVATHQIPIFRFRDGFSNMRNNQQSVGMAVQTLIDKKALLVFAEGNTSYQFDARPLQKGFARIGFQALYEKPDLDIKIVPVGISFNRVDQMGSDVILNIGEPFDMRTYYDEDTKKQAAGMTELLDVTHQKMKDLMLINDATVAEQKVRNAWHHAAKEDRSFLPKLVYNDPFFTKVKELIDSKKEFQISPSKKINGKQNSLLHLFWIVAIPSLVFTILPRLLSNFYKNKKVKKLEFKMPVALAVGLIIYLLLLIIGFIFSCIFFTFGIAILFIIGILISGFFHLLAWENWKKS